jgi:ABC-type glycerol-3-phosphate transport system substrate-binding protein
MFMFQGGVDIINNNGQVKLGSQGENALAYYTQFADAQSSLYTWNPRMHYSLDAFYEGKAAMMINYSWHYDTIKRKNAKLNYAVSELPQSSVGGTTANYANYWAFAVSKNKLDEQSPDPNAKNQARIHEAWQFLKYLSIDHKGTLVLENAVSGNKKEFSLSYDPATEYLLKTGKPAARRDILEQQKTDTILGPFVTGNLIAKSWRQTNSEAIESVLAEMINSVNIGAMSKSEAIKLAEDRIQTFIGR